MKGVSTLDMENSTYFKQAQLMLRVIPHVTAETCFALKGGTAINLFLRDMPRLSVDIDSTYLPLEPRPLAVRNIGAALARIASAIRVTIPGTTVQESRSRGTTPIAKLFVRTAEAAIKIEPNHVLRGAVLPTQERDLSEAAEALFELSVTARTLSVADLYGRMIRQLYANEFVGMVTSPVAYDALVETREKMLGLLQQTLTEKEKRFLLSLKIGQPEWALMAIDGIDKLPAIQWKWMNIQRMSPHKRADALEKLQTVLGI